jgi:hypothetical protein
MEKINRFDEPFNIGDCGVGWGRCHSSLLKYFTWMMTQQMSKFEGKLIFFFVKFLRSFFIVFLKRRRFSLYFNAAEP